MRFFLLLVAAFVAILARDDHEHQLPDGLPNGSVLTLYMRHTGDGPISINFYNRAELVKQNGKTIYPPDIPVRLELTRGEPVYSWSMDNMEQLKGTRIAQIHDEQPPWEGYWRVDIIKLDNYRLNIFFQGFWSGIRTFKVPLNEIKSFAVKGDYVTECQRWIKLPNADLAPLTAHQFKDLLNGVEDRRSVTAAGPPKLTTLPGFPLDGTIELSAVLRAKVVKDGRTHKPTLVFKPVDGSPYFLKIHQEWTGETHRTFLGTNDDLYTGYARSVQCSRDSVKPNGDLVHLKLTRIRYNVVEMRLTYKHEVVNSYRTNQEFACWVWIAKDLQAAMDRPFKIMSHDTAMLLNVQRSYSDSFTPSSSAVVPFSLTNGCECDWKKECMVCDRNTDKSGKVWKDNCVFKTSC